VVDTELSNGLVLLLMYSFFRRIIFPSDFLLAVEDYAHETKAIQQTDFVFHPGKDNDVMATQSPRRAEPLPQIPVKPSLNEAEEGDLVSRLMRLTHAYGPVFQLNLPQRPWVITANYPLANELCDEQRFVKKDLPFRAVRQVAPTSIFAVSTTEPVWSKAHKILLSLFSTQALQAYMPKMWEATMTMMYKWERLNPDEEISVYGDMVRLTSDIIGLCCLDYRFQSFYRETPHPLIQALMRTVEGAIFRPQDAAQWKADGEYLHQMTEEIIRQRRATKTRTSESMLDQLLESCDPQTSEKLTNEELRDQIITLLFAGHITTSTLLSFAIYELIRHPIILAKAHAEVDRVLGNVLSQPPTAVQLSQLPYLSQIMKETLRLHPPARLLGVQTVKDEEMLGDTYQVTADQDLLILVPALHRDPSIWGNNAEVFQPDRFLPDAETKIPANAYKPFGNGMRACLGRAFAWQEASLVLGMLLQHFELIDHTNYHLTSKTRYATRPEGFTIQVRRRAHAQPIVFAAPSPLPVPAAPPAEAPAEKKVKVKAHHTPLFALFGSNLGTSEGLAQQIGDHARDFGFTIAVDSLDEVVDEVSQRPEECALVIVASSYNGYPPTNATRFYDWLQRPNMPAETLKGVRYAVFGCGNRQWSSTYQAVPTFIDQALARLGAERVCPLGMGDASGDLDGMFQSWQQQLWPALARVFSLDLAESAQPAVSGPLYRLEVTQGELTPSPYVASYNAVPLAVLTNMELQHPTSPHSTRCIEVELPKDVRYKAGDHLGVLAHNPIEAVERIARRFGCDERTVVRIHKNDMRQTTLPIGTHIRVYSLLSAYVELHEVATRRQITRLLDYTELPSEREHLRSLVGSDEESEKRYRREILEKHVTLLDLVEMYPSCDTPAAVLLEFLPPLRPRYYSISSSALVDPNRCRITVGVLEAPAVVRPGIHQGTCSTFLSRRTPGEVIYGFVQDTRSPFHHPADPSLPIIMVGAGTGLAPFMGFLQERAAFQKEGKQVGPSLLFFGCRHPEQDFLYQDELEGYTEQGLIQLHVAFSRAESQPKAYVQDKILEQQDLVWHFLQQGAPTYICGDMEKMVPGVAQAYRTLYQRIRGTSAQEAAQWLEEMIAQHRYVVDIWGSPGSF
jgi:cytochrome P450 / NADPH-cytochrome P450 reductase